MSLTKQFDALKISPNQRGKVGNEFNFHSFFSNGSGGRQIFQNFILPFLSMRDLIRASRVSRQMNGMCRTYTIGDVLEKHSITLPLRHKLELGKLVIGAASGLRYESGLVYKRVVRTETRKFSARLYHPCYLTIIELAMVAYFHLHYIPNTIQLTDSNWVGTHCLPMDPTKPVLESAKFGRSCAMLDVTVIIRFLLIVQGNRNLTLMPPRKSPRFWYIWLFGDPCPGTTKVLCITSRDGFGKIHTRKLKEDERCKMPLTTEPSLLFL